HEAARQLTWFCGRGLGGARLRELGDRVGRHRCELPFDGIDAEPLETKLAYRAEAHHEVSAIARVPALALGGREQAAFEVVADRARSHASRAGELVEGEGEVFGHGPFYPVRAFDWRYFSHLWVNGAVRSAYSSKTVRIMALGGNKR